MSYEEAMAWVMEGGAAKEWQTWDEEVWGRWLEFLKGWGTEDSGEWGFGGLPALTQPQPMAEGGWI
jgi:hypothetical protein